VNSPLNVKENYEHLLDFALHFPLGELQLCLRGITINEVLVTSDNPGQEGCIVESDLTKLLEYLGMLLLLISCQKSHQDRYMTPNVRTQKISMSTHLRKILYTDSKDMLVLIIYHDIALL
jgi:hypothetical protein